MSARAEGTPQRGQKAHDLLKALRRVSKALVVRAAHCIKASLFLIPRAMGLLEGS